MNFLNQEFMTLNVLHLIELSKSTRILHREII